MHKHIKTLYPSWEVATFSEATKREGQVDVLTCKQSLSTTVQHHNLNTDLVCIASYLWAWLGQPSPLVSVIRGHGWSEIWIWSKNCPWNWPTDPETRWSGELKTSFIKILGHHPTKLLTFEACKLDFVLVRDCWVKFMTFSFLQCQIWYHVLPILGVLYIFYFMNFFSLRPPSAGKWQFLLWTSFFSSIFHFDLNVSSLLTSKIRVDPLITFPE